MKQPTQIIFFYRIFTFLKMVKSGMAHVFLLPLKKCLANLAQQQSKTSQLVSFSDKTSFTPPQHFKAEAQILPLNIARFSPEEAAIDDFFNNIQLEQVKDELNRWFFFGLAGHGKQIAELTPEQVEYFKTELPLLISALYNYHCSTRKEASNGA